MGADRLKLMHVPALAATFVLVVVLILATASAVTAQGGTDITTRADVEGTDWRLVSDSDVALALRLADGRAIARDACGQLEATYALEPDTASLLFDVADGSTLCPANASLAPGLAAIDGYEVGAAALTMVDAGALPILEFVTSDPSAATPRGRWLASGYDFLGTGLVAPRSGSDLTVVFGPDGVLDGNTGCGGYIGTYSLDGSSIRIGIRTTGVSPCGQRVRNEEIDFTSALQAAVTWVATSGGIDLVDGDGLTRVRLSDGDRGSIEGEWTVLRLATPKGRLVEPLGDVEVWLGFGADELVEGSSGCRIFDGEFLLEGDRIAIGPVSPTGQPCSGDFRRQERRVLAALDAATAWTREDLTLQIRDGAGETVLELTRRIGA